MKLNRDELHALQNVLLFVYEIGLPDSMEDDQKAFDSLFDKVFDSPEALAMEVNS